MAVEFGSCYNSAISTPKYRQVQTKNTLCNVLATGVSAQQVKVTFLYCAFY